MSTYRLIREQIVSRPLDEVFAFFADARNLETLTPPWLRFEILTPGEIEMQVGSIIQYALRVHGLPIHWTTAITVWNPPFEFVDVQLRGPYVLWHHRHTFDAVGNTTRMVDEVNYRLPLGWMGRAMHSLMVRRDLKTIFDYREQTIKHLLESGPNTTAFHSSAKPNGLAGDPSREVSASESPLPVNDRESRSPARDATRFAHGMVGVAECHNFRRSDE